MSRIKYIFIIVLLLSIIVPVSAFAFYKPIRVMIPEIFDINCQEKNLCVEDIAQLNKARDLFINAKHELKLKQGLVVGNPKIIFCSTNKCKKTFGLSRHAALNVGTFGIIIAPRGWSDYYVSHELIHSWQSRMVGNVKMLLIEKWMLEGMAYSLSKDPRNPLSEPFQSYRIEFDKWCSNQCSGNMETTFKSEVSWW